MTPNVHPNYSVYLSCLLPSLTQSYVYNIKLASSDVPVTLEYDRTVYKMHKKALQNEDDHPITIVGYFIVREELRAFM